MSTVNFSKEVAFEKTPDEQDDPEASTTGNPIYNMTFKYPKEISP